MCYMKIILLTVTELWAGQNITLIPWGTRSWGQMSHFPRKAHLDPLRVLHVQCEKNPPTSYRVMGRTRIFTWAYKHITLTPQVFHGQMRHNPKRHIYIS